MTASPQWPHQPGDPDRDLLRPLLATDRPGNGHHLGFLEEAVWPLAVSPCPPLPTAAEAVAHSKSHSAFRLRPPLTEAEKPRAVFASPPLIAAVWPLAVFPCPPLTAALSPLAVFPSPPLTDAALPLAVLSNPPLTEALGPLARLKIPPFTEALSPLAVLSNPPLTEANAPANRVLAADHQAPEAGEIVPQPHHHVVRARALIVPVVARLVVAHEQVAHPVGGRCGSQAIDDAQVGPGDHDLGPAPPRRSHW